MTEKEIREARTLLRELMSESPDEKDKTERINKTYEILENLDPELAARAKTRGNSCPRQYNDSLRIQCDSNCGNRYKCWLNAAFFVAR